MRLRRCRNLCNNSSSFCVSFILSARLTRSIIGTHGLSGEWNQTTTTHHYHNNIFRYSQYTLYTCPFKFNLQLFNHVLLKYWYMLIHIDWYVQRTVLAISDLLSRNRYLSSMGNEVRLRILGNHHGGQACGNLPMEIFENLPFQFFIQRIYSSCSETHNMTWLSLSTKNMWENQQIQVTSTHQDNFDIPVGLDLFSHKRKPSVAIYVNMCQIQTFTCWKVRAVAPSNNKSEDWNTKQVKTC